MGPEQLPQVWTQPGDDVHGSVEVNRMIGAGVGVIMIQHRLSYEAAAAELRDLSRQTRRSLLALAQDLLRAADPPLARAEMVDAVAGPPRA